MFPLFVFFFFCFECLKNTNPSIQEKQILAKESWIKGVVLGKLCEGSTFWVGGQEDDQMRYLDVVKEYIKLKSDSKRFYVYASVYSLFVSIF